MDDIRALLSDEQLARLRAAYDAGAFVRAEVRLFATAFPPLAHWNEAIATTFYAPSAALAAVDRERCIIALLAHTGQELPLAFHIYWGLMEGLSVEEIGYTVGLAGCYGGVSRAGAGLQIVGRTLRLLQTLPQGLEPTPSVVQQALVEAFTSAG